MNIPQYNSTEMLQAAGAMSASSPQVTSKKVSAIPETFGNTFSRATRNNISKEQKAQDAAAGLVSNALILPVLEQIRRGTFCKNTIFQPGIAENTFGPEFDIQIADRIAQSPNMSCTKAIKERLLNQGKPISRVKKNTRQQTEGEVNGIEIYG